MRPSARRGQQLDSFASTLAAMVVTADGSAAAAGSGAAKPKWRESASDVDDREEEEDDDADRDNNGSNCTKTVRAAAKAGARRRGSGNRQHLAQAADATNMTARSAYWKLFASREWRQHTAGLAVARRVSTDSSCEESADDKRKKPMDPPSSTEDGSDDGERREAGDEVEMLREQVALLVQNLEKEKQRRTVEQNLMQSKIIELQGLIRRNLPEQQRALERRFQSRPSPSGSRARNAAAARSASRAHAKSGGAGSTVSHCHHTYHHHLIHHHQARGCSCETNQNQLSCYDALLERSMSMPTTLDRFPTSRSSSPKSRLSVDVTDNQITAERLPSPELSPSRVPSKTTPKRSAAVAERMLEASMKKQICKMRARMMTTVAEAEREAATLRTQLAKQINAHEQRERQMRLEFQVQLAAADERQRRTAHKAAQVARQVVQLTEEKQQLAAMVNAQAECIRRLQLAVGGRQIVEQAEKEACVTSTSMPELR